MSKYLITFFETLARLAGTREGDVPNKIDYQDGSLHVLISMGDLWARIPIAELDADPFRAAEEVLRQKEAMSFSEIEDVLEGR